MAAKAVRESVVAAALMLMSIGGSAQEARHGRKYVAPPPVTHIAVHVVRQSNGKPVANAAVVFHPLKNGKDAGNMELKTDQAGVAELDLLPQKSSVLLQVIADGYQTYGQTYAIDGDEQKIEIVLQKPGTQYTAYGAGAGTNYTPIGSPDLKLTPLPPAKTTSGEGAQTGTKQSAAPAAAPDKP